MNRNEIEEKVRNFLIEDLEIDEEKITPDALLKEDLGIDSLDFVDIVVIVERNFALQVELATVLLAHTLGIVERRRTAHIVAEQLLVFVLEIFTLDDLLIAVLQVVHTLIEYLRHIGTAKLAEESVFVYIIFSHNDIVI